MPTESSGLLDVKIYTEVFNGEFGMGYLGSHRLILSDLPQSWVCSLSLVTEQSPPTPRLCSCDPLENAFTRNDSTVSVRLSPSIPVMMSDMRTSRQS